MFASCSKDEEMTVVGNWDFTTIETTSCNDPDENGNLALTNGCATVDLLIFQIEICGNAVFTDTNYTITLETTVDEETETEVNAGTYSISGDKITFTNTDGEVAEGTVNGDRNSLVVSLEDEEFGCIQTITMVKK